MIKKAKYTVQWKYFIGNINSEKTVGTFYKQEL